MKHVDGRFQKSLMILYAKLRSEGNGGCHLPSPTYQCTKARLAYMRSNLWSSRAKASTIAVVLLSMHRARCTFARSPPGIWKDLIKFFNNIFIQIQIQTKKSLILSHFLKYANSCPKCLTIDSEWLCFDYFQTLYGFL